MSAPRSRTMQLQQRRPSNAGHWTASLELSALCHLAPQALWVPLQGIRTLSAAATEPLELHDAIAAERFQQGSVLDWDPEVYRAKTGGGIPRVLHHMFLDGEQEYDRWVTPAPKSSLTRPKQCQELLQWWGNRFM